MKHSSLFSVKRTRLIAILICICFLTVSCSTLRDDRTVRVIGDMGEEIPSDSSLSFYPYIYSFDRITGQIVSYSRSIPIDSWADSAEELINTFLESLSGIGFSTLSSSIRFRKIIFCSHVANIYLDCEQYISEEQQFYISSLLSNTVIRNYDVDYVNVVIGDRHPTVSGKDIGLLELRTGILSEAYESLSEEADKEREMSNHSIYLVDRTYGLTVPEVRSISIDRSSDTAAIISAMIELADSSLVPENMDSPLEDLIFRYTIANATQDFLDDYFEYSAGRLDIYNAQSLLKFNTDGSLDMCMCSALFYTIKEIVPALARIVIHGPSAIIGISEQDVEEYLGREVSIYLPGVGMDSLHKVTRIIPASEALNVNMIISLIGKGTVAGDPDTVVGAFTGGLSEKDLISVRYWDDCVILDFSKGFTDALERLTDRGRYLMIYSIVNTLCEIGPLKRVQFMVNGEKPETISGSELDLHSPLLANPGLIIK